MKELTEKHRSLFFGLLKSKWSIKICKVAVISSKIVEDNNQILDFLEHWWLKKDELSRDFVTNFNEILKCDEVWNLYLPSIKLRLLPS